jgi:flagellar biosynthesis GTPase FlhF
MTERYRYRILVTDKDPEQNDVFVYDGPLDEAIKVARDMLADPDASGVELIEESTGQRRTFTRAAGTPSEPWTITGLRGGQPWHTKTATRKGALRVLRRLVIKGNRYFVLTAPNGDRWGVAQKHNAEPGLLTLLPVRAETAAGPRFYVVARLAAWDSPPDRYGQRTRWPAEPWRFHSAYKLRDQAVAAAYKAIRASKERAERDPMAPVLDAEVLDEATFHKTIAEAKRQIVGEEFERRRAEQLRASGPHDPRTPEEKKAEADALRARASAKRAEQQARAAKAIEAHRAAVAAAEAEKARKAAAKAERDAWEAGKSARKAEREKKRSDKIGAKVERIAERDRKARAEGRK